MLLFINLSSADSQLLFASAASILIPIGTNAMNIRTIILSFLLMVLCHEGYSCSCDYAGNFIKVSKDADLVALIRIIDHEDYFSLFPEVDTIERPMSVRVEIIKKYSGDEERKEVNIFGDNGYLCRESIRN